MMCTSFNAVVGGAGRAQVYPNDGCALLQKIDRTTTNILLPNELVTV